MDVNKLTKEQIVKVQGALRINKMTLIFSAFMVVWLSTSLYYSYKADSTWKIIFYVALLAFNLHLARKIIGQINVCNKVLEDQ
jgi:ACT domain-containing protein